MSAKVRAPPAQQALHMQMEVRRRIEWHKHATWHEAYRWPGHVCCAKVQSEARHSHHSHPADDMQSHTCHVNATMQSKIQPAEDLPLSIHAKVGITMVQPLLGQCKLKMLLPVKVLVVSPE